MNNYRTAMAMVGRLFPADVSGYIRSLSVIEFEELGEFQSHARSSGLSKGPGVAGYFNPMAGEIVLNLKIADGGEFHPVVTIMHEVAHAILYYRGDPEWHSESHPFLKGMERLAKKVVGAR